MKPPACARAHSPICLATVTYAHLSPLVGKRNPEQSTYGHMTGTGQ